MFPSDIEKFKFRLGSVISGLASLKSLKAKILEPSHILTDQILGAFGPKLKEIEITGPLKVSPINMDNHSEHRGSEFWEDSVGANSIHFSCTHFQLWI